MLLKANAVHLYCAVASVKCRLLKILFQLQKIFSYSKYTPLLSLSEYS